MRNKRGIMWDYLFWVILGLAVLILGLTLYSGLTGKSIGFLDFIKNMFRFGR